MTYDEFKAAVLDIAVQKDHSKEMIYSYMGIVYDHSKDREIHDPYYRFQSCEPKQPRGGPRPDPVVHDPFLYYKKLTGGAEGGNCWGDETKSLWVEDYDRINEFTLLNDVLTVIVPKITYLEHRKISSMVKTYECDDNEYYGNYKDYEIGYLSVRELYDTLREMGYLGD